MQKISHMVVKSNTSKISTQLNLFSFAVCSVTKMSNSLVQYSVVDAFTEEAFKGNPAAVCFLEEDKGEAWLQSVASEFNISETCYLIRIPDAEVNGVPRFGLRWFTPVAEVPLCGHATLAASHALFTSVVSNSNLIEFSTLSGILTAKRVPQIKTSDTQNGQVSGFLIELDFPTVPLKDYNAVQIDTISKALNGASIIDMKTTANDDLFIVLPSAKAVQSFEPQFDELLKCPGRGVIISAVGSPGSGFDFYSRFFCPELGINEDPVCGSAHCALAVYWSDKLGKEDFIANAASPRGGIVNVHLDKKNQRVLLRGKAVTVMKGSLLV